MMSSDPPRCSEREDRTSGQRLDAHGFLKPVYERLYLSFAPGGYVQRHHTLRRRNGEHKRDSIAGFEQKPQEGNIIPPDPEIALHGLQKHLTPLKPADTGSPPQPFRANRQTGEPADLVSV
jgi:hypothetical protein